MARIGFRKAKYNTIDSATSKYSALKDTGHGWYLDTHPREQT